MVEFPDAASLEQHYLPLKDSFWGARLIFLPPLFDLLYLFDPHWKN